MILIKRATWLIAAAAAFCLMPDAQAQSVGRDMREKTRWHHAPPEYQIIDDRPIIKDFREAPSRQGSIQLPPGPQASGAYGGGGAGAMGDGPGLMPSGGLQLPSGQGELPYRSDLPGMGAMPMEKSGFGRHTNIPAAGMAPKGALPNGTTTGIHGKMTTPIARSASPSAGGMGTNAGSRQAMAPTAASYGGDYTRSAGGGGSSGGMSSSANVHAKLLNRLKGN